MKISTNLFTGIIVLIVGIYDLAYAFNRRHQPNKKPMKAYTFLGVIFTILGLVLLILSLLGIKVL